MNYIAATVRSHVMTTAVAAVFAALLFQPVPYAFAAGDARPMMQPVPARMAPAGAHASRTGHPDPRIAQFNLELAAYKQTVAALRRNTERLMALQNKLDALVNELSAGGEINMIQLQSLMSNRQTAVQLSSNMMKALNESEKNMVNNIRP